MAKPKEKPCGKKGKMKMEKKNKWIKRAAIILAVAAVLIIMVQVLKARMFPTYEGLPVSGSHTVETTTFTWEDESRIETFTDTGENRALTVSFWYPGEEGKYPLVVFSHGAFGVIDSNYSTYTELASNGYVVASIGHPYHAMFVEDVNGKTTIVDMEFLQQVYADNGEYSEEAERQEYDFSQEWMQLRTADMNFVLDTILAEVEQAQAVTGLEQSAGTEQEQAADTEVEEEPSGNETKSEKVFSFINTNKIGLMGHSMGGATAVQLGRERNDITAVIDLEGTMLGEYVGFENGYELYNEEPYPIPVLDVNSKAVREDIDTLEAEHPGWEYVNDYLGRNAADYREVIFNDAGHLNFTDLPLIAPPLAGLLGVGEVDAEECIKNVNEVVLTFFNYYLKEEGSLETIKAEY